VPVLLDARRTDVLADVLDSLKLRGRVFCRCELSAPWSLGFPAADLSHFHVIERGTGWLRLPGKPDAISLDEGDLLVVPPGHAYQLSDDPSTPPIAIGDLFGDSPGGLRTVLQHGGGGRAANLICGSFEFGGPQAKFFLAVLPDWIRVKKDERQVNEWLDATMRFLARETQHPDLGAATIVTSLIDVMFVEAVRAWLKAQPAGTAGWLGALRDPSIGAALGLIHQAPEKHWTVPALSAAVGLSRSPFAARFTALVGLSPMAYLKQWRLQMGASLLSNQALALSTVAERVGYESSASFSRAFTREFGVSPGLYRRRRLPVIPIPPTAEPRRITK
jgi:AraC-like DNA-binding protein